MNDDEEANRQMQIVVVGFRGVGKSSLITRWTDNYFEPEWDAIGGSIFKRMRYKTYRQQLELKILELGIYQPITRDKLFKGLNYKGADVILVMYDVTCASSLKATLQWKEEMKSNSTLKGKRMVLIGNKADWQEEREVSQGQGRIVAESMGMHFAEISTKSACNCDYLLSLLVENYLHGK